MTDPLMDKNAVAAYIGGISPRTARELMKSMPCINVASGEQKKKLRVYQSDLIEWLEARKHAQVGKTRSQSAPRRSDDVLDASGHIARRRPKTAE